tara:strand:+ start:159 stop:275 length:117 start_codon:yes stop_codon:yes gene_type:complete
MFVTSNSSPSESDEDAKVEVVDTRIKNTPKTRFLMEVK